MISKIDTKKINWGSAAIIALLLVAAGMMVHAVVSKQGLFTYVELRNRAEVMQKELDALKTENEAMKKEIHALKNDPETIERAAREELGMIKNDEVLYKIENAPAQGGDKKSP